MPTEVCTKANSASDRQLVILSNGASSHGRCRRHAGALSHIQRESTRYGGIRFPFRRDYPLNRRNLPSGEPALPVEVLLLGDLPGVQPRAHRGPRPDRRVELPGSPGRSTSSRGSSPPCAARRSPRASSGRTPSSSACRGGDRRTFRPLPMRDIAYVACTAALWKHVPGSPFLQGQRSATSVWVSPEVFISQAKWAILPAV